MANVIVCGGRDFDEYELLETVLDEILRLEQDITIIHGGARGADRLAGQYSKDRGYATVVFPADWDKHKKGAGYIRNQRMLDEGKPDMVIAFPGGKGTKDMVKRSVKSGVRTIILE